MRRERILGVVAVATLLVTAGIGGAAYVSFTDDGTARAQSTSGDTAIEVTATGSVETQPDEAIVRVSVVARGTDVEKVRQWLAENSSSMRSALEEMGVASVRSVSYDIGQDYRERRKGDGPTTYVGRHAFVVTVSDPSKAGDVVVTAVENGASRVENVVFTIDESTRQRLRQEALAEAMESARTDASTLAEAAGTSIVGVDTIRTGQVRTYGVKREVALAAGGDGASTNIAAGPVTVTATVTVTYNASS